MENRKQATRIQSFLFNRKLLNSKCSQANMITVVLIILLVIVALIIVWNIIQPLIRRTSEQIGTSSLTTQLEIENVTLWETTGEAEISVKRGAGKGNITSLKFVFYDRDGKSYVFETSDGNDIPGELESKTINIESIPDLGEVAEIEKLSIVPVFGDKLGMEVSKEIQEEDIS